jgi:hypothetical protein
MLAHHRKAVFGLLNEVMLMLRTTAARIHPRGAKAAARTLKTMPPIMHPVHAIMMF